MSTEPRDVALADQAFAAADALLDEHGAPSDPKQREVLRCLLGIAWVQGRCAGGAEALAVTQRVFREILES